MHPTIPNVSMEPTTHEDPCRTQEDRGPRSYPGHMGTEDPGHTRTEDPEGPRTQDPRGPRTDPQITQKVITTFGTA